MNTPRVTPNGETVKRGYRSDLRAAQAQQTRRRVVTAAADLFVATGYGGTSVDAIAAAAGVSRKTVFTVVGGKAELLSSALDFAIAGDDAPVPLAERPEVAELMQLDDAGALLTAWAQLITDIDARVGALFAALDAASSADQGARELFEKLHAQRRDGARAVVAAVAALGPLRDGLSRSAATDLACLFSDPSWHRHLVGVHGWSGRRFATWLAGTLQQQLLTA
ncbi:TetR/AcrR family transcriptional regulator [Mycobacterium sp. ITM-2016-00317]|uniref:TetR/AcrR family transcriptional regulator n=1 Tax=Mycobacterium sp. ITM-2016-00317 TaxID=2099694 RepID=UPI00287F5039|nr:TetR/AcrR family transcriptional regulator [Mycobacterium sp. ITM-2016-00317]WNG85248.1 TetR/AcrR family transcriptional regulator [Mycobacterium sp. ITM-2016-00317]